MGTEYLTNGYGGQRERIETFIGSLEDIDDAKARQDGVEALRQYVKKSGIGLTQNQSFRVSKITN